MLNSLYLNSNNIEIAKKVDQLKKELKKDFKRINNDESLSSDEKNKEREVNIGYITINDITYDNEGVPLKEGIPLHENDYIKYLAYEDLKRQNAAFPDYDWHNFD